ncbi:DUF397 domain-containing protein [Streptomyces sp. NPDC088115]|uniref:DUF397 domain-containing protein n=1 Tax=Streptomyces sp. NPDC088115 TaxID=3365824 RepID=UPI00381F37B0
MGSSGAPRTARQIRPDFFRSGYSARADGEAVECAERRHALLKCDSKTADGAVLRFTRLAWGEFTASPRGDGPGPR